MDANVFIAGVEGDEPTGAAVRSLLSILPCTGPRAVTSELTLAEVLAPRGRPPIPIDPELRRDYLDVIVWSGIVTLVPVSRDVLYETVDLRSVHPKKLALPDAIHLVTAIRARCRFFMTADQQLTTPEGMEVVRPDEVGTAEVIALL